MSVPYHRLQQYALAISFVSVLYNGAEGAISLVFGAEGDSRALVFFGIQSAIEVASALIVLWRFRKVAKPGEERSGQMDPADLRVEKIGTYSIGVLIAILALAAEGSAIAALITHSEPDSSNASIIISASALACMIALWLPKRWLAKALDSSTMAGEATCSLSCIQITLVLFTGSLIFRLWHGGWWVDSATTIVLGLFFAREAQKMLSWVSSADFDGGCCGDCRPRQQAGDSTSEISGFRKLMTKLGFPTSSKKSSVPGPAEVAVKLELGTYKAHDVCSCCLEKKACREADSCQCESEVTSRCSSDLELPCCVPRSASGEKCCTREPIVSIPTRPPPGLDDAAACTKGCCTVPDSKTSTDLIATSIPKTRKNANDVTRTGDCCSPRAPANISSCCTGGTCTEQASSPTVTTKAKAKGDACCNSADATKLDDCCASKPTPANCCTPQALPVTYSSSTAFTTQPSASVAAIAPKEALKPQAQEADKDDETSSCCSGCMAKDTDAEAAAAKAIESGAQSSSSAAPKPELKVEADPEEEEDGCSCCD